MGINANDADKPYVSKIRKGEMRGYFKSHENIRKDQQSD